MELKGKIIDFLGDSITEGIGVADMNNRYDQVMLRTCRLKAVYNYGVSGSRFAHQTKPSEIPRFDLCFCGRAYDMNPAADIIVVYGGINDFIHGDAPVGGSGDRTPATFCGAVHFLMNFLKTSYPEKMIVFMTPAHCNYMEELSDARVSDNPNKRADALPLPDYVKIIKDTAGIYQIPVLDLYADLGIDPNNPADYAQYTADGLHFNDAGHHVLAEKLSAFLRSL
ncbi:MAG: SGNH/GDSL hydrolase family protein [Clostridiaceae bacterium]|nr:SGNH/GDSL hydrolase family protein [Clostridiaceae bacterium]